MVIVVAAADCMLSIIQYVNFSELAPERKQPRSERSPGCCSACVTHWSEQFSNSFMPQSMQLLSRRKAGLYQKTDVLHMNSVAPVNDPDRKENKAHIHTHTNRHSWCLKQYLRSTCMDAETH